MSVVLDKRYCHSSIRLFFTLVGLGGFFSVLLSPKQNKFDNFKNDHQDELYALGENLQAVRP